MYLLFCWHSDPESDNSDSSDSDFEPEKEVYKNNVIKLIIIASFIIWFFNSTQYTLRTGQVNLCPDYYVYNFMYIY